MGKIKQYKLKLYYGTETVKLKCKVNLLGKC